MAKPVDVPAASVVSSMKRCLDVLSRPSLGRYSTSYESYRAAASMLLPFLISSLEKKGDKDYFSTVCPSDEIKTWATLELSYSRPDFACLIHV